MTQPHLQPSPEQEKRIEKLESELQTLKEINSSQSLQHSWVNSIIGIADELIAISKPLPGYEAVIKDIRESIANFLPADCNIDERPTLDALNCLFREIISERGKSSALRQLAADFAKEKAELQARLESVTQDRDRCERNERDLRQEVSSAFNKHGLAAGPTAVDRIMEDLSTLRSANEQLQERVKYFESCALHTDKDETIIIAEIGKLRSANAELEGKLAKERIVVNEQMERADALACNVITFEQKLSDTQAKLEEMERYARQESEFRKGEHDNFTLTLNEANALRSKNLALAAALKQAREALGEVRPLIQQLPFAGSPTRAIDMATAALIVVDAALAAPADLGMVERIPSVLGMALKQLRACDDESDVWHGETISATCLRIDELLTDLGGQPNL